MGVVRWTGEAFQIVGRLLTNKDLEQWLEGEGRKILEDRLKNVAAKWLMGKSRAKRHIKVELLELEELGDEEVGDAFRTALATLLNALPERISEVARILADKGPNELVEVKTLDWVAAVPRELALRRYRSFILSKLENAAALRDYPGLSSVLLTRQADEAEDAFFHGIKESGRFVSDPDREVFLEIDINTKWWADARKGHYYVARSHMRRPSLSTRSNLNNFLTVFDPLKQRLVNRIGLIDKKTFARILTELNGHDVSFVEDDA